MNVYLSDSSGRRSNIELLRIFAMLMIVAHHLAVHGVMHYQKADQFLLWSEGTSMNRVFSSFLFPGGEVGVAVFFIVMGYFSINKKRGRMLRVLLQTSFYGLISFFFFAFLMAVKVPYSDLSADSLLTIIKTIIFPGTGGSYWFVLAYMAIVLLMPFINPFLSSLSKRGMFCFLLFSWAVWYSLAAFLRTPYFNVQKGLFFYCIGAYIQLHKVSHKRTHLCFVFLSGWIIAAMIAYGIAMTGAQDSLSRADMMIHRVLVALETSVPVPVCSTAVFLIFNSFDIGTNIMINAIASTTFGVYLLHDFSVWRRFIWQDLFKVDTVMYRSGYYPFYAIALVLCVFTFCSVFDWVRLKWIEPVCMNKVQAAISKLS